MAYDEKKPRKQDEKEVSFPFPGIETRISRVADLYESRKQAAGTAHVALSSLQRWIAGEGMPAFDSLAALATGKGVSLDWIATGQGDMFLARRASSAGADDAGGVTRLPLWDSRCTEGSGPWSERVRVLTQIAFDLRLLDGKELDPVQLFLLKIDGDSMEGMLSDGDTVVVDLSRNVLEGEAIYVIYFDGHLYPKRLQRQLDGSVAIISQNRVYPQMNVSRQQLPELEIAGRVVWASGWI
jgi:phage repressor protein C with HTH and peptisase S24 domain